MEVNGKINCELISDPCNQIVDNVEYTYNESFPEEERRDFSLIRKLIAEEERFHLYVLCRDEKYVGFITSWAMDGFTYIEHFAIDESARNGGIGGKAFKAFIDALGCPIVLEVELPVDDLSKRRVGFYERLGFIFDDHLYYQPPYREGEDSIQMRLMTCGEIDLKKDFVTVKDLIHKYVYGVG